MAHSRRPNEALPFVCRGNPRLRGRHGELDRAGLCWHLARAPELDSDLDECDLAMTVVENNGPPLATAKVVLGAIGWPLVTLPEVCGVAGLHLWRHWLPLAPRPDPPYSWRKSDLGT